MPVFFSQGEKRKMVSKYQGEWFVLRQPIYPGRRPSRGIVGQCEEAGGIDLIVIL